MHRENNPAGTPTRNTLAVRQHSQPAFRFVITHFVFVEVEVGSQAFCDVLELSRSLLRKPGPDFSCPTLDLRAMGLLYQKATVRN